ncbi:MAG: AfsR/SARP family transcriptional regulator [Janthinobacterium lividum]
MDARWQIRLLGTFSAQQGEIVLTRFATSRVAALLARLALFPQRIHSREELADALWPEADLDAGRLNLRVALASLRRQMEPPGSAVGSVLISDRNSIQINSQACCSDASLFEASLREAARTADLTKKREALQHALALYEGELLPGFYDEWILEERERLQALHDEAEFQFRTLPKPKFPVPPAESEAPIRHIPPPSLEKLSPPSTLIGFPIQFTRFFGRSPEKSRLAEMLCDPEVRLVTLLGPGGAGKTRLALETARQVSGSFDGVACFVPLADISDSALIASAIASALRMPLSGDRPPLDQVAAHLSSSRALLVLDNMEQLGEAGAAETRALMEQAPHLTCLVTSRQKLNLEGEREYRLAALPVPTPTDPTLPQEPADLIDYPSVQLFVDRAQAVRPDFQVTPLNAEAVAAICRSLEGMPLALELAAARIQALTPSQMQQQLEARLDFLTSRRRDLPPRHRSLRAALEWSTQLLTPEQTRFFIQLSVFRGGWTLEAAASVCGVSDPLTLLEQLCERSLIAAEESPLEMRFRMLESMREFGEEQLSPEEKLLLAQRHAGYFQQLATQMDTLWNGSQQSRAQVTLDTEQDNLRAALTFCCAAHLREVSKEGWSKSEVGLRLAGSLGNYWTIRGLLREGLDWLEIALTGTSSAAARAGALAAAGWLAAGLGDAKRAEISLTESIDLSRSLEDKAALASALRMRGVSATWHDNYPQAAADLEEALALSREIGDNVRAAVVLNSLGVLAEQWQGDKVQARSLYEEALALFLKFGDQQRAAYCLHNLGNIAQEFGDPDRAIALLRESIALAEMLGDLWHRAYCLRSLGDVWLARNDLTAAAGLLEEGIDLCRQLGDRMSEAGTLLSLATVRRRQSNWMSASALARSALLLYQAMGQAIGKTECWMNLADTSAVQQKWEETTALLSAAAACRNTPPVGDEHTRFEGLYHAALGSLSQAAFDAAWERGRALSCDEYGLRT